MVDYREILRLHNLGYSQRVITSSVHSSRSTVKEVIDSANAFKIEWPLDPQETRKERCHDDTALDGILRNSSCCR